MLAPSEEGSNGASRRVVRSSPLVQRLAAEHNVDISQVQGTGIGGRVSKRDILQYIEGGASGAVAAPAQQPTAHPLRPDSDSSGTAASVPPPAK